MNKIICKISCFFWNLILKVPPEFWEKSSLYYGTVNGIGKIIYPPKRCILKAFKLR